jgi:DNA polymerase elongation subunit (family B)
LKIVSGTWRKRGENLLSVYYCRGEDVRKHVLPVEVPKEARPYFYIFERDLEKVKDIIPSEALGKPTLKQVYSLGERCKVIRIECPTPSEVGELSKRIEERGVITLESHIEFHRRFMLDVTEAPISKDYNSILNVVQGNSARFNGIWVAVDAPAERGKIKLRKCYIDTEVSEEDEKTILAFTVVGDGEARTALGEEEACDLFAETLASYDIIVGWNVEYDFKKMGRVLEKRFGEDSESGARELLESAVAYDLLERYMEFRRQKPPAPSTWKLKDVYAHEFGKKLPTAYDIGKKYIQLYRENPELLKEINMKHAMTLYELDTKYELSSLDEGLAETAGLPIDKVSSKTVLLQTLIKRRFPFLLIPGRALHPKTEVKGALVLEPLIGLHENVAVFDFASLYPRIIESLNIPYVSQVVGELLRRRLELKKVMKEASGKDQALYDMAKAQQTALKVAVNAMYGCLGRYGGEEEEMGLNGLYWPYYANKVTEKGRMLIEECRRKLESLGYGRVVYGDTDSIFYKFNRSLRENFHLAEEALEELNTIARRELTSEAAVELDKIAEKMVMVSKKKYCMLLSYADGKWLSTPSIQFVGMETVRGDWTPIARETLEKVAEMVFSNTGREEIVSYLQDVWRNLIAGKYDEKLILYKTLSKPPNKYGSKEEVRSFFGESEMVKAVPPHVRAAIKAEETGYRFRVGDKVEYVIVSSDDKIEVEPVVDGKIPKISFSGYMHYFTRQILPPVERLLKAAYGEEFNVNVVASKSILEYV